MKKHWLRGVLLGVSLALLLAGGVALAAGLKVTVDQECIECWPGAGEPTDEYEVVMTFSGYNAGDYLCLKLTAPPKVLLDLCANFPAPPPELPPISLPCAETGQEMSFLGSEVHLSEEMEDYYGQWTWELRNPATNESDQASFYFAEDCSVYDFVPEPGTLLLLGSGLAGLAGYATLRWRSRE